MGKGSEREGMASKQYAKSALLWQLAQGLMRMIARTQEALNPALTLSCPGLHPYSLVGVSKRLC